MEDQRFGQRVKRTFFKGLKLVILLGIITGAIVFSWKYRAVYDEDVRAGNVLRISKKGLIFKTFEGQLNLRTFGALKGSVSPIMEAFDFSVEGSEAKVIKDLEAVALSGERVNLHYIKRYANIPLAGDTKYFITRVERVGQ